MRIFIRVMLCTLLGGLFLSAKAQSIEKLIARANEEGLSSIEKVRIWGLLLGPRLEDKTIITENPEYQSILADTINNDPLAWMLLGRYLESQSRISEAMTATRKSMLLFQEQENEHGSALAKVDLAHMLSYTGDQTNSTRLFFEALSVVQEKGPRFDEALIMNGLGFIFRYQDDFRSALEYYDKELILGQELDDNTFIISGLRGNGGILMELDSLEKAEEFYQRAASLAEDGSSLRMRAVLKTELANLLVARLKYGEAVPEYEAALTEFEKSKTLTWAGYLNARLAFAHHKLGNSQKALEYGEAGLELALKHGLLKEQLDNLNELPKICADLGMWEKALNYSEFYEVVRDSIRNDAISTELARIDIQQEQLRDSLLRVEQLERERFKFETDVAEAKSQRNLFMIGGLGVLILVTGLWSRLRYVRRIERELAHGNKLIEEEKLRAERSEMVKDQFLSNMSHEIRTPMNAIMGMTANLRRTKQLDGQSRYLDAIAQSSSNLLVILDDILDLGKLEEGKLDLESIPMDIRSVVTNVVDILRFKAEEKGLILSADIDDSVPQVIGDPTRLNQILLNLVGNGIKFTEKGEVMIKVSKKEPEKEPMTIHFQVIDTGIGISENRIRKIFEEFTQAYSDTTRKYGGTGLGLTITQRLVELQGGTIEVESTPSVGSTFTVEIPYRTAPKGTIPKEANPSDTATLLKGLRILLAEDNEFNVMVARDELNDMIEGVEIEVAVNGAIAVDMVKENTYDVILMDIQMPEMNGFEATEAIRNLSGSKGRIPILAMTANVLESEVQKSREIGMNAFVPKPFEREDLLGKLKAEIAKSRMD